MKKVFAAASLLVLFCVAFAGCRSAFVSATITNQGSAPAKLVEVDYPSASFGVGAIAPGAQFRYRFKIQGDGPIKLQYTDASGKVQTGTGPDLHEGQQGSIDVLIDPSGKISWKLNLSQNR